jgi:hypothetical protein
MNCHDARELFSALIDSALTREERADVYGHLATCAECRRELTAIERTIALVRGASPVRAPAGFVDRVARAVRRTPWYVRAGRAALLPWPIRIPLGAAALLLVGGLAVLVFRGTQEQQRAARPEPEAQVFQDRRFSHPGTPPGPLPSTPPAAEAPGQAPATPSPDASSSERAATAPEQDRTGAIASRVDQADKRAETEQREAAPAESSSTRAPAPTAQSAPPAATDMLAKREAARAKAAAAPQVIARLAAPDRDTAERALAALAARLGGTITGRRVEGNTSVVDLAIPRERYDDFTREAARLGVLRVESEPSDSSDTVRIAVHLVS